MKQANGSELIYLTPEDELPTVRERLEQIAVQRVILVVPIQTQLRTYSIWRALYAHARRLGKDVRVISSDTHIRSAARGAKFQVSRSLNITSSSKLQYPQGRPSLRHSYPPEATEPLSLHSPASHDNLIFDTPTPTANLTFSSHTSSPQQPSPLNDSLFNAMRAELDEQDTTQPSQVDEQFTIIELPELEEHPMPMRPPKLPKPLDMPHSTSVRIPPRRPHWDDDSELSSGFVASRVPPRRTHLVPPARGSLSRKQLSRNNPFGSIVVTSVVLIGLYIIIKAAIGYMHHKRK